MPVTPTTCTQGEQVVSSSKQQERCETYFCFTPEAVTPSHFILSASACLKPCAADSLSKKEKRTAGFWRRWERADYR
ncbi:small integral membrane protein 7 isoform X1 [Rhinoraja longicauda]